MTRQPQFDPGFDPRVADWLEADPSRAPAQALETVLAAFPSIPQQRPSRLPWQPTPLNRLLLAGAAVAALIALAVGSRYVLGPPGPNVGASHTPTPSALESPRSNQPSSEPADYSTLPGRILAEHLGNAIDGSEMPTANLNPDRRRFYFLDPATMTGDTAVEFLPGQPATGKTAADVSFDSRKVVFQDWAPQPRLYEANLDGTGFRRLPIECDCQLLYPDYNPGATQVVYVRIEGDESWLEIYDLAGGDVTPLEATRGPASDAVPEQPAWSPNGATIAFSRLTWAGRNDPVVGTVRYGDQPPVSGVISLVDVARDEVRDVTLPDIGDPILPGDVNWSPDGEALVFTHGPASTAGSVAAMPAGMAMRINPDGTGFATLTGWGGPRFTPDGAHILVQSNEFYLISPDGTDYRPVNENAMDLSDIGQGFVYIGHWIDEP